MQINGLGYSLLSRTQGLLATWSLPSGPDLAGRNRPVSLRGTCRDPRSFDEIYTAGAPPLAFSIAGTGSWFDRSIHALRTFRSAILLCGDYSRTSKQAQIMTAIVDDPKPGRRYLASCSLPKATRGGSFVPGSAKLPRRSDIASNC